MTVHYYQDLSIPNGKVMSARDREGMEPFAPLFFALLAHISDPDFEQGEKEYGCQPLPYDGWWVSILDANPYRGGYHLRYLLCTDPIPQEALMADYPVHEAFDVDEVRGTALTPFSTAGGSA